MQCAWGTKALQPVAFIFPFQISSIRYISNQKFITVFANVFYSELELCVCVHVCMCACAARPQSLQTVGGNDHRLHTLKPTDSSPRSISTFPFMFSLPPYRAPRGTTDSTSFIHLQETFISHQHPFIHPSPSFLMTSVIRVVHQSLSGTQQQHLRLN